MLAKKSKVTERLPGAVAATATTTTSSSSSSSRTKRIRPRKKTRYRRFLHSPTWSRWWAALWMMVACIVVVAIVVLLIILHGSTSDNEEPIGPERISMMIPSSSTAFKLRSATDKRNGKEQQDEEQQERQQQQLQWEEGRIERPPHLEFLPRDWPVMHVVHTRFMQHQPNLLWLGRARLLLFETFCLPTMVHQTAKRFLWIISTDPSLHVELRNKMIQLLRPYPNFYLVASNVNFGLYGEETKGSWQDGTEGSYFLSLPKEQIYTGNLWLLEKAHDARTMIPSLETRLDADDGLHEMYLQYVQQSAIRRQHIDGAQGDDDFEMIDMTQPKWFYWCSRRHLQWFPPATSSSGSLVVSDGGGDARGNDDAAMKKKDGGDNRSGRAPTDRSTLLRPVEHSHLCVSAGITVGYPPNARGPAPIYAHDVLWKRINAEQGCGRKACIEFVDTLAFGAVRSRTTTSAGMLELQIPPVELANALAQQEILWQFLEAKLHINQTVAAVGSESSSSSSSSSPLVDFLKQHQIEIAQDNLKGQCTHGHSCKLKAKEYLQRLVEQTREGNDGVAIRWI